MSQKQLQLSFTSFSSSTQQINRILQSRLNGINEVIGNDNSRLQRVQVPQNYMIQIAQHCSQYAPIRRQVQQMITNEQFFKSMNEQSVQFWSMNQKIQKELQKRLQTLKSIDRKIQDLIDKQNNMANQIQDIQQIIRSILSKKQPDHISKAQPLYTKKQSNIQKLQEMKRQKQIIKDQKLEQLTIILQILKQMKTLRMNRLQQCRYVVSNKESITLLQCMSKDLQQVVQNRKLMEQNVSSQNRLLSMLQQSNHKIVRLSKQLMQTFQIQQKCLLQLNELRENRSQLECFNSKFVGYFDVTEDTMLAISQRFTKFIQSQSQKSMQLKQVTQGINTTQDTIEIFQNIKHNLQTQTIRKNQLIERINNLTKVYSTQRQRRQQINVKQVKIQSLKINHNKLLSQLQQAAQQADVRQYKIIHQQINQLQQQINIELTQLQRLKSLKRQSSKKIYSQTNLIQQEFRDLISQILPQIWLRDHDFNKEETIADFQVYLTKLFGRLKILA